LISARLRTGARPAGRISPVPWNTITSWHSRGFYLVVEASGGTGRGVARAREGGERPRLTCGWPPGYPRLYMRAVRLRYSGLGILLLGVTAALLMAWLRLSHVEFGAVIGSAVFVVAVILMARDGWRQTSTEGLISRGIPLDSVRGSDVMDPGLRREMVPIIPGAVSRWMSSTPTRRPAAPRPAAPSAGMTKPARSRRTRRADETLQPDATITLVGERRTAGIDDLFVALDNELIGLVPVKKKVEEIGSLLLVDRARQRFGLSASRPNLHMCFTGAPGTGKTTVALMMADLLHRLGYLEKGHLVHAMRDDLVGEYIGHTAPKTKQVLERAMGGVLFIDEAYTLYRTEDSKDYGQECIDILMQVMENERDKLVVILAGYKDRMDIFFESNPGMSSRIAHHLDFAQYEVDELLAIGQSMLDRSSYYLSHEAVAAFRDYMLLRMRQPRFANARSVRNELESARLRHAYRLAADPERHRSKDDLMRLEPSDIPSSRDLVTGDPP
jgi:probable Rubsico expression protein CbbX